MIKIHQYYFRQNCYVKLMKKDKPAKAKYLKTSILLIFQKEKVNTCFKCIASVNINSWNPAIPIMYSQHLSHKKRVKIGGKPDKKNSNIYTEFRSKYQNKLKHTQLTGSEPRCQQKPRLRPSANSKLRKLELNQIMKSTDCDID